MKILVVARYLTVIGLLLSMDYGLAMHRSHQFQSDAHYERMFKEQHYEQWCLSAFESIKNDCDERRITNDVYDHRIGQLACNIHKYIVAKKDPMLDLCRYIKCICDRIESEKISNKVRAKNHPNFKNFKDILKASGDVLNRYYSCSLLNYYDQRKQEQYKQLRQGRQEENTIAAPDLDQNFKMIEYQKKREQANIWLARSAAAILVAAGACVSIRFALEKSPSELVQLAMESITDGIGSLIDDDLVTDFLAKLTFFNESELDLAD